MGAARTDTMPYRGSDPISKAIDRATELYTSIIASLLDTTTKDVNEGYVTVHDLEPLARNFARSHGLEELDANTAYSLRIEHSQEQLRGALKEYATRAMCKAVLKHDGIVPEELNQAMDKANENAGNAYIELGKQGMEQIYE